MSKGPKQLSQRVPIEVGTIQVNFSKNSQCQNFGIPASTTRQPEATEQRNVVGILIA